MKTRPISFLYNGGPGAATIWLHMGSFAPKHVQMADEGFQPAPPFKLEDNESSLIDVTDHGFRRRDLDRLQPHGTRRELAAVPRPDRRHPRVRRIHQRLAERVQPMAVAEISHRRKLRHDPLGRPLRGAAAAPRHRSERHRPHLVAAHLPDAVAVGGQRHRVRGQHRDVHRRRVVSQEAAGRSAGDDDQAGRRSVARVRMGRLHGGADERQHAHRRREDGDGAETRAASPACRRSSS